MCPQIVKKTSPNIYDFGFRSQEFSEIQSQPGVECPEPGFYGHLFLRPKKDGSMRPVFNLKPLVLGELDGYDAVITSEQDIGYPLALPGYDSLFFGLSETTGEIDWEVDSNSFSHHSRPVVLQATSDVEDQGAVEGTAELRSDTHIDSGMQDRAGMVGRIPGNLQWSIIHCSEPGHDHNVGCLESWVGSGDREQQHAGSVVARREQLPYQPIGVTSCRTRAPSVHKEQDADASALAVRQQDGRCLPEQARRNTVVTATPRDERRLGILHATENHNYCGISAGEVELPGRSREQSVSGQQQLAIGYSDFCSAPITMGDHDHQFIRRSIEHTTESVCELEARPISEGDGRILIHVDGGSDVCISPVLSGKQMPREVGQGQGGVGVNNADMAHSDMVSRVIGDVGGGTDPVTGHGGPAEVASGAGSPFDSGRQAPTSSVADQWQGPKLWRKHEDRELGKLTATPGRSGLAGVSFGRRILFKPLWNLQQTFSQKNFILDWPIGQ